MAKYKESLVKKIRIEQEENQKQKKLQEKYGIQNENVRIVEPIKELRSRLIYDEHVFTGASGTNVLRLLPPLCLSMEEAKEFLARFKKVL